MLSLLLGKSGKKFGTKQKSTKNKTVIILSGDKIHSVRVNKFFQTLLLLSFLILSVFLTYHITIYLNTQSNIEAKDNKIFLNEKINQNLSANLNLIIEELDAINDSLSNLGVQSQSPLKQNSLNKAKQNSANNTILTDEELTIAYKGIREAVSNLDSKIASKINLITSQLSKLGIGTVLNKKKIASYNLYKKNNLISKNINYSVSEIASSALSEMKYKLEYINTVQHFIEKLPIVAPVKGSRITSRYGLRMHPVLKRLAMHRGIDYKGIHKGPIQSTAEGKVQFAGWSNSYGNLVILNHGNGITTRYAHMSKLAVKTGQLVKKNDVIGFQGSTGRSTGEHLHYEVRYRGKSINPVKFLRINNLSRENNN